MMGIRDITVDASGDPTPSTQVLQVEVVALPDLATLIR
jgi:hypothetical protein